MYRNHDKEAVSIHWYVKERESLLERLGMVRKGVFREELYWRGKRVDQFFYAILGSEYRTIARVSEPVTFVDRDSQFQ